jgi:hypothetical protein
MRTVTFDVLSGLAGFNVIKTAPVIELVQDLPNLLKYKILPSFKILNVILKSGKLDTGVDGGCEWSPFELNQEEYDELVTELIKTNSYLYITEHPEWVKDYSDWYKWVTEKLN